VESAKAKQKPTASAPMTALVLADKSREATGKLPPSSCKQDSPTHVTCTGPAPGASGVVFLTYPSLTALYTTYTAKVTALNSDQFKQNFNVCGAQGTYREVGGHPGESAGTGSRPAQVPARLADRHQLPWPACGS
jgi:hypothetical protein